MQGVVVCVCHDCELVCVVPFSYFCDLGVEVLAFFVDVCKDVVVLFEICADDGECFAIVLEVLAD